MPYRFTLRPGVDTIVDVKSYRSCVTKRIKLASRYRRAYPFGANQPSKVLNYRREFNDPSGLADHAGNGRVDLASAEQPEHLSVSNFSVENPCGLVRA